MTLEEARVKAKQITKETKEYAVVVKLADGTYDAIAGEQYINDDKFGIKNFVEDISYKGGTR